MKSFRARIIAWTVGIAGIALLLFGVTSMVAFYRLKMNGVDEHLRQAIHRNLAPPRHANFWERYYNNVGAELRRRTGSDLVVVVYSKADTLTLGAWPEGLIERLALPEPEGELRESEAGPGAFRVPDLRRNRNEEDRGFRLGRAAGDRANVAKEFRTIGRGGDGWRFVFGSFEGFNVAIGVELKAVMRDVSQARFALLISLPAALLLLGLGTWFFATKAIQPIRKLTAVSRKVSARNMSDRLSTQGEYEEFGELIEVFNGMLDRLERSFNQATRFSADAAHELKTPLTILQGNLESALQKAPDGSPLQRELASLLDEAQRLKIITRKLLVLSQADSGNLPLNRETINLGSFLAEEIEEFASQALAVRFESELAKDVFVNCDTTLIGQIVQNLISNAIKYNHAVDGLVRVTLRREGDLAKVEVENTGAPIPDGMEERLFDRFVRLDTARNRSVDGFGLGLSLSREFANAHGGELVLADTGERSGRIVFRLSLRANEASLGT